MPGIWVPPKVSRDLQAVQDEHNAMVLAGMEVHADFERVNRELKAVDPLLELAYWPPNADATVGLKPGRVHIIRHNPGAPVTAEILEYPDGSPMEPGCSAMWKLLEETDMWSNRTAALAREAKRKAADAYSRAEAHEHEERAAEIDERIASRERESILFSPDIKFRAKPKVAS